MVNADLIKGNELYRKSYFKQNEQRLVELARKGQKPKVLFIGCADSRIDPNLMTQATPGDLFVLRNVGNFVAPYKADEDFHATAAGIEYAVSVLNVSEIIICGHTHCGACEALYQLIDDNPAMVHTKTWLSLGQKARILAQETMGPDVSRAALLRQTEMISVVTQIEHLLTYPAVSEGVAAGRITIHGWMFDIETGRITYYDPDACRFVALPDA